MTSLSGCWRDTGGKACADDAKVRAKATAINLSIASLPFFDVLARPDRELRGGPMAQKFYIVFGGADSGRPAGNASQQRNYSGSQDKSESANFG